MHRQKYHFNFILVGDPLRPVIVLLHGFLGSITDWQGLLYDFAIDYYCLAIDLPGHGQTRVSGDQSFYTMPNCARGIIDLLDELELKQANLLGYSMGGRLALYLAVHYPERWSRLIVESASPGLPSAAEKKERWQEDQERAVELEQGDMQKFIRTWYEQPIFKSLQHHPQFAELQRRRGRNDPFEIARSMRGMSIGKQKSLWNNLSEIPLPIMMLVGDNDPKYKKIGTEMKKQCPALELKVVGDSGHLIHFENPQLYAQYIRQFLQTPQHS